MGLAWHPAAAKLWAAVVVCPLLASGQTNNPLPNYPINRYLLVVETSHSMQRRADSMIQSIQDLLGSALAAQARRGDSLGVWTFNEALYSVCYRSSSGRPSGEADHSTDHRLPASSTTGKSSPVR